MFDLELLLLFLGLSWILIVTPGPDLIYVLTRGIANGKKAGIISALGVSLGILIHTLFAAMGLSVILQNSAAAFSILKYIGAGYLIFLGIKSLMSKDDFQLDTQRKIGRNQLFMQGLLSNTLNPKVALFFIAFLPQFVQQGTSVNVTTQLVALGSIFCFCTLLFLTLLGYFSGSIGSYLNQNRSITRWLPTFTGLIMILLGFRLAFQRKP